MCSRRSKRLPIKSTRLDHCMQFYKNRMMSQGSTRKGSIFGVDVFIVLLGVTPGQSSGDEPQYSSVSVSPIPPPTYPPTPLLKMLSTHAERRHNLFIYTAVHALAVLDQTLLLHLAVYLYPSIPPISASVLLFTPSYTSTSSCSTGLLRNHYLQTQYVYDCRAGPMPGIKYHHPQAKLSPKDPLSTSSK